MSAIDEKIADVYDAARAYVGARLAAEGVSGAQSVVAAVCSVDRAWHELAFFVLGECVYCDRGTCPFDGAA